MSLVSTRYEDAARQGVIREARQSVPFAADVSLDVLRASHVCNVKKVWKATTVLPYLPALIVHGRYYFDLFASEEKALPPWLHRLKSANPG